MQFFYEKKMCNLFEEANPEMGQVWKFQQELRKYNPLTFDVKKLGISF